MNFQIGDLVVENKMILGTVFTNTFTIIKTYVSSGNTGRYCVLMKNFANDKQRLEYIDWLENDIEEGRVKHHSVGKQ
jgi:hypothetical protein